MSTFDPYRIWLGIPPHEQPPNYYRLLGLSPFETDAEVIANAADRQMAHLRTFQGGKNSSISQKILNEVAAARICLLDPIKHEQYDAHLRAAMQKLDSPNPPQVDLQNLATPPIISDSLPIDRSQARPNSLEDIGTAAATMTSYYRPRRKKNRWQGRMVTLICSIVGLLVALAFIYIAVQKPMSEPTVKKETNNKQTAISKNTPERPTLESPHSSAKKPSPIAAKKPADTADENEKYGKRLCFLQGNWSEGLPKLAASANKELKSLAEKELANPTALADRLAVADGWWAVSEKFLPPASEQIRRHAVQWYQKVLGDLEEGPERDRAEWRIAQETPLQPGEKPLVDPEKLE